MPVLLGCQCADGFGVAHDHVRRPVRTERVGVGGQRLKVLDMVDTGEIRIWVTWRQVVRELGQPAR